MLDGLGDGEPISYYLATQTRELTVEAHSAAEAREIAEAGFAQKLNPKQIKLAMSVSNIHETALKIEKVR